MSLTAASAAMAFSARCRPGTPNVNASFEPRMLAVTLEPASCGSKCNRLRAAFRLLAERNNRGAMGAGMRREPFELLIARRQDSGPALLQAFEDLRLRVRDIAERVEELDVDGRDPGDDGDVRAHEARQRRNLARVVHADFEHAEAGAVWACARAKAARPRDCCRIFRRHASCRTWPA